jgi:hypothetical protein
MDLIAIGVVLFPIHIYITVLYMDEIVIGIVFIPRLKSITVLGMDTIAIGVVFANGFVVVIITHGVSFF